MAATPTPDQRAASLASRQHGAISMSQATSCGLSARQVELRVGSGQWAAAGRAVYVVAGSADTHRRRAWAASLATGGVLSHLTSAWLHGLLPASPVPHVTVARNRSVRSGVAVVHRGAVPLVDQATVDGLRCTSASRTVVDLAALVDRSTLESALDDAICRGLASPASIAAAADRVGAGRRGLTMLRGALAVWRDDIEPDSSAEVRLLRLLDDLGLHDVVTQHYVYDLDGAFVAKLDVAVPQLCRAFEYDSVRWHNPRAWDRDEPRYARLRSLGWDVAPVTKLDLLPGATRLRDLVERWRRLAAA